MWSPDIMRLYTTIYAGKHNIKDQEKWLFVIFIIACILFARFLFYHLFAKHEITLHLTRRKTKREIINFVEKYKIIFPSVLKVIHILQYFLSKNKLSTKMILYWYTFLKRATTKNIIIFVRIIPQIK